MRGSKDSGACTPPRLRRGTTATLSAGDGGAGTETGGEALLVSVYHSSAELWFSEGGNMGGNGGVTVEDLELLLSASMRRCGSDQADNGKNLRGGRRAAVDEEPSSMSGTS